MWYEITLFFIDHYFKYKEIKINKYYIYIIDLDSIYILATNLCRLIDFNHF